MAQNVIREDVIKLTTETDSDGINDLLDGMSDLQDSLDDLSGNDAFDDLIDSAQEFGDTLGSRVQDGIERMRNGMQTGMDNIKRNIQNSADAIGKFGEKMVSSGKKVEGLGKSLKGLSVAAGGALGGMVAMASSFEDAMAKVNTIADTNSVSLNDLSKQIMDLSNQTGISANEIADATYNAISAGQSTADSVNFVSNATSLARAGFTDTASSIDILTTIMNAYGMEADKVTSVSDMLIQTQNKGKTTVAELASAMGKVIPTANSMGVGLEQLTAGYAIMTANGIATAETTTYMNSMLNELGKSSTVAGKALQKSTGKSFQELIASGKSVGDVLQILKDEADKSGTAFNEMWGSAEAGKAGLVLLTNGVDGYNDMVKQMLDSTGATSEALGKLETPSQKAKVALNQVKNTAISFGQVIISEFAPYIDKASKKFTELTEKITNLSPETKKIIVIILGVVAALSPVLIVIGKVMQGVGGLLTIVPKITSAFTGLGSGVGAISGTLLGVVAVIAVVVAAFVHLWQTNENFRNNIISVWEKIKTKFEEFTSGIVERINELGFNFESFTELASAVWNGFCEALAPIFVGVFEIISDAFSSSLDVITGLLDLFTGLFTGDWDKFWKGIEEIFLGIWNGIKSVFEDGIKAIEDILDVFCSGSGQTWEETWTGFVTAQFEAWDDLCNNVQNGLDSVAGFFTEQGNSIADFWNGLWEDVCQSVDEALDSIVGFFTEQGDTISDFWSDLWNDIVSAVSEVWDGITSVFNKIVKWFSDNIIEPLKTAFTNYFYFVVGIWAMIYEKIVGILTPIAEWFDKTIIEPIKGFFNVLKAFVLRVAANIYFGIVNAWNTIAGWVNTNVIQPIIRYWTAFKESVTEIFKTAADFWINVWNSIPEWLDENVVQPIVENWQTFCEEVTEIYNTVVEVLQTVWGIIAGWVNTNVIQPIIRFFNDMKKRITEVINNVKTTIVNIWGTISSWVNNNVIQPIKNFFNGLWSSIKTGVETAKTAITGAFQSAYNSVTKAWGGITDFFNGIWKNVSDTVQKIIDKGKEALGIQNETANSAVQTVKGTSTSETFGGKPIKHADGGLITTPHFGLIGEAGPEMIIPLSNTKRDSSISMWAETGEMLGVTNGTSVYEPSEMRAGDVNTHTENNTYAPVFNLTVTGGSDRSMERKVKQWIRESMEDMFESVSRQNPRLREV